MIQSLIHTTENNNSYIYDDHQRLSLLIHPEIIKAHEKLTDADQYYLEKYEYLKKHKFFSKHEIAHFGTLNESMVKDSIIRTKQIVFEVTDRCNLNCTYCGYGELYYGYDIRNHKKINTRNAINLLKYIFDLKPKNDKTKFDVGFYGGEPLLNIYFIKKIVETVKRLILDSEIEITYSMTTNATLLHKHIDFLTANNFNLLISLDGSEENHSYRTFSKNNKNSFRKIIKNVDLIQRTYPEYFANHVRFNAVLHDRNSVKDIYEFIYTRYNKVPRIAELAMDNVKPCKIDIFAKMFHSKIESETEYQKEECDLLHLTHDQLSSFGKLTDFLKYYSINFYVSNIPKLFQNKEEYIPTSTCLPFSRKIFLTTQNKLLPCEKINYKHSIGKVDELVMIDFKEITRRYNFYYDHFKKVCQFCYAYRFCGLCLYTINNLDKLNIEGFNCRRFSDQEAFRNMLYHIFSFLEKHPNDFFHILENVTIT